MVTFQSVHGHTGLTHLNFVSHSECQSAQMSKNLKGGLDQYGTQCFGRLIFATVRKSVGLKRLSHKILAVFVLWKIINLSG